MITAWLTLDKFDLKSALEKTIATMQAVLNRTLAYAWSKSGEGSNPGPRLLELKLIQSRQDILEPKVTFQASKLA